MTKFKVGDKVRICEEVPAGYPFGGYGWTSALDKYKGLVSTIIDYPDAASYENYHSIHGKALCVKFDDSNSWYFYESALTFVENSDGATPRKHAELIHAWADGAEIQRYDKPYYSKYWVKGREGGWKDVKNPTWKDTAKYRVKPIKEMEELEDYKKQIKDLNSKIQSLQVKIFGKTK